MGQGRSKAAMPVARAAVSKQLPRQDPPMPRPRPVNDVADRPAPPETRPIIEPGQEIGDWDRGDPRYSALVQQVVGKIETQAPGGDAARGHHDTWRSRPMPANRHTGVASGMNDDIIAESGRMSAADLKEAMALHESGLDMRNLALRFKVDERTLTNVLSHVSLLKQVERREGDVDI